MPTALVAPVTGPSTSAPFTVAAGAYLILTLTSSVAGTLTGFAEIETQSAGGVWNEVARLTPQEPRQAVQLEGTYRVYVPATAVPVGVDRD